MLLLEPCPSAVSKTVRNIIYHFIVKEHGFGLHVAAIENKFSSQAVTAQYWWQQRQARFVLDFSVLWWTGGLAALCCHLLP